MKTKSKGDLHAQLDRIRKTFYSLPNWHKGLFMEQMVRAKNIAERYHENINKHLGDYDIDDSAEFHRRYDLQIPRSIYAGY